MGEGLKRGYGLGNLLILKTLLFSAQSNLGSAYKVNSSEIPVTYRNYGIYYPDQISVGFEKEIERMQNSINSLIDTINFEIDRSEEEERSFYYGKE